MNSVINAITAGLILLGAGTLSSSFYHSVKKETVLQVHRGMCSHMTAFTRKITGSKLKF
jgi:hypothetical protein